MSEPRASLRAVTEPAYLTEVRAAYDTVADDYAALLRDELAVMPFDRAMLATFAELVRQSGPGPVADLGCGPGRVTAHLAGLGLDAWGMDLSPGMVDVARRSHPGLRFEVGTLSRLDVPDAALAGVVAWYSLIHTAPDDLPAVLAELARVLRPGGELLTAFQVGDARVRLEQAYGHTVSYDVWRIPPERLTEQLAAAGLRVHARLVRDPAGPETTARAYLLARKA